jgi:transmembrane sensor
MNTENKDTLYARWLINDLTPEEKSLFEKSNDAETLKKITDTIDNWSLPELKQNPLSKIKTRVSTSSNSKIIPLYKKTWFTAMAAAIALIVCSVWFFSSQKPKQIIKLSCYAGETKNFTLPDGSLITLSGNSKLSYNATDFIDNRNLDLQGEGYFEVRKKGGFEVNFAGGTVKVMGTKFTILSDKNLSSVKCFEGKVEVDLGSEKINLEKGNGVRKLISTQSEKYNLTEEVYQPEQKEIHFNNTPLAEVCASLSLFYNVSIITNDINLNRNFTGLYKISNLDTALFMVFEPMGISFKHEGSSVILKNK